MNQTVNQSDIGPEILLEVQITLTDDGNLTRISNDDLCPLRLRTKDARRDEGMSHRGIRADDEDAVRPLNLRNGVGHRPAAKRRGQPGHRGGVSEAGAVVDVVRPKSCPGKLLQ